jgi:hypothetical protein
VGTGGSFPGREADRSHASISEARVAWSYTSGPPYFLMAGCGILSKPENFLQTFEDITRWFLWMPVNSLLQRTVNAVKLRNCWELTHYINASYVVWYEWVRMFLFQCIVSILWGLTIFWYDYMKCNKGKGIPVTGHRGSHVLRKIGSQMTARLSSSRSCRPLPPGKFLVIVCVRGWVDPKVIVRLEIVGQLEKLMASSGIEPATFRLLA